MSNELEDIYLILSKDVSFALDMERLMVADLAGFSGCMDNLDWSPINNIDAFVLWDNLPCKDVEHILSGLLLRRPKSVDGKSREFMSNSPQLRELLPRKKVKDMEPGKLFRILGLPGLGDCFLDFKGNILQKESDSTIATLYRAKTETGYKDLLGLEVTPV